MVSIRHGLRRSLFSAAAVLALAGAGTMTAAPAHASSARNWQIVTYGAHNSAIVGCKVADNGAYGPVWRVYLLGINWGAPHTHIFGATSVRGSSVVNSWSVAVRAGGTSAEGQIVLSRVFNDTVKAGIAELSGQSTATTLRAGDIANCS